MKAIVFERNGGFEVLQYKDIAEPKPGPNEVLLKVKASACNFNDIWARRGLPGMDIIMPAAVTLKYIAAPIPNDKLKALFQIPPPH